MVHFKAGVSMTSLIICDCALSPQLCGGVGGVNSHPYGCRQAHSTQARGCACREEDFGFFECALRLAGSRDQINKTLSQQDKPLASGTTAASKSERKYRGYRNPQVIRLGLCLQEG